jgi:hypothetical protein
MGFVLNGGYAANLYGHSQFPDSGFSYRMGWTCGFYRQGYVDYWGRFQTYLAYNCW